MKGNKTDMLSFVVIILLTDDKPEDTQSSSKGQQTNKQRIENISFLVCLVHSLQKKLLLATDIPELKL